MKLLCFSFLIILLPSFVLAKIVPQAMWESKRIKGSVMALAIGNIDADPLNEIAYISDKELVVADIIGPTLQLNPLAKLKIDNKTKIFRVNIGSWGILLTGFQFEKPYSALYIYKDAKLKRIKEFDEIILPLNGNLYSQSQYPNGDWAKNVQKLTIHDSTVQKGADVNFGKGLLQNKTSLFDIEKFKGHEIFLFGNHLHLFQEGKKLWKSSVTYGGAAAYVDQKRKDSLGVKKQPFITVEPPMRSSGDSLFLVKNDMYIKNFVGAVPRIKTTQFVEMQWTGNGFQEKKVSPRLQGAITDLRVFDIDQDGKKEIIFSFLINQYGYLTKNKGFESVLVVMPGE